MAGDDVTIRVTSSTAQAQRAFRELKSEVRGLKGTLVPLASAAVPLGAAFGPIAAKAAGAGAAVAAFGVAVAGQVSYLSEAAKAQDKYTQAVTQYGRGSKQAAEAQRAVSVSLASMPQATARASVGLSTLKGDFKSWSDEMAQFTMAPVEKSFTLLGQMLPKLTPMVQGASSQLDRLVTVAGGAMTTPGFDALAEKVSLFANDALKSAVDGVIHFSRALSEGDTGGPLKSLMEYAAQNGPALRETLSSVGAAVSTLAEAAANAGPGMLTLVNAAAGLVAALPPELVTVLMQTAVALKLVTLAGAGAAAVSGGIATLGARIGALTAASAAAGGGLAGLAAAFGTLSVAARASVIVAGIGLAAMAISKLSDMGKEAPPNVDRLTTSLTQLGRTGQVTGEAASHFGVDLGKLHDQLSKVVNPSVADSINNWGADITGGLLDASDATESFTENVDAIDASLADMVKGGNADLAKAALDSMLKGLSAAKVKKFKEELDGYDSALADLNLEQDMTADSMSVFGEAAAATSAKLEAQKSAADGLRASILALNDVNRSAHDAETAFEASLDGLAESFEKNGASLDKFTDAGRANREAMSAMAQDHGELLVTNIAAGDSFASLAGASDRARESMLTYAESALGSKEAAREYVNALIGTPESVETFIKLEREEAISGLQEVRSAIQETPGAKEVTVTTLNAAAIAALEAVGLKTERLPDGRTKVSTKNGQALDAIGAVSEAMSRLDGKTANTFTTHTIRTINEIITNSKTYRSVHDIVGKAAGGLMPKYADGDRVQMAPNGLIRGPGTGTSDDILALFASGARGMVSDTEYVVNAKSTQKYLPLLEMINKDKIGHFAKGGVTNAEREARNEARGQLGISRFGQMAGWRSSSFGNAFARPDSLSSLVNALHQWRGIIQKATHGSTEGKLLRQFDSTGRSLIKYEKQLGSVTKSLDKARDKLDSLKDSAAQLSNSVKGNILSAANITRGASGDGPVTLASIRTGLVQSRDKATAFAGALQQLKGKGLSGSLLQQVAEAGIEGGGLETAGALLGASESEIRSLNDLQSQIASAAGAAGKATADAVYGAQIKAQEKLVKSLAAQQSRLIKSMDKLTAAMEKAIERAFGRKASGGIVGAAASGGLRSSLTWVGEQGPELLDLPAGSRVWSNPDSRRKAREMAAPWASMLNAPRRAPRSAAAVSASRPEPIVLELRSSGSDVDEFLLKMLRRAIRNRGGNVNVVLTGRP